MEGGKEYDRPSLNPCFLEKIFLLLVLPRTWTPGIKHALVFQVYTASPHPAYRYIYDVRACVCVCVGMYVCMCVCVGMCKCMCRHVCVYVCVGMCECNTSSGSLNHLACSLFSYYIVELTIIKSCSYCLFHHLIYYDCYSSLATIQGRCFNY